nr:unnamed protein product [Spirometra erinaceieuropaei]
MVTVGATRVLCGIKVKVMPTLEVESPFICSVEQTNLSQRTLRANVPVGRDIQTLSIQLDWILRTCAIPDAKEQLLIYFAATDGDPGLKELVCGMYLLHVDVLILHDDGCLLDACLAAALAALSCAKWPRVEGETGANVGFVAQTVTTSKINFREVNAPESLVRLHISDWPVALTFCLVPRPPLPNEEVKGRQKLPLISQPSRQELLLWDTDATIFHIVLNSDGVIVDFAMCQISASARPSNWTNRNQPGTRASKGICTMSLKLHSIVRGKVVSIKDFGAFVSIEGSTKQGLVHRSQISNHRVDDASEVLEVGEMVFCKIISKEDDKIGLSMKFVNQTSGEDKDPNNVLATQLAKRRQGHTRDQNPIRLEAELNTVCSRCKGKGHMANTCFARLNEPVLNLLSDSDSSSDKAPVSALTPRERRDSHQNKPKHHKHKHRHRNRSLSVEKEKEKKKKKRKRDSSSKSHKTSHKKSRDS